MRKHITILAIMAAFFLAALAASPVGANPGKGEVIGVTGIVPGQDMIVHILALVAPGANRSEVAKAVLASQGARAMTKQEFSTTGLVWDRFGDGDPGNNFVIQNYNPSNDPTSGGLAALLASQATWTAVTSSSFAFQSGDENIKRCPSLVKECRGPQKFDGNNDVAWVALNDPNTLGVTWYGTSIEEADMALNTNFTWATNGTDHYDVETVFLHENGHASGLGHSIVTGAIMEAVYAGVRRGLDADDVLGLSTVYPSGAINAAPAISITSPGDTNEFATGATIAFAGTATDAEDDQDLNVSVSVAWTSSIDGNIGTGTAFIYADLTDGVHTITAIATDTASATATDSISILVGPAPTVATTVGVTSISYATSGGKNSDKNLLVTLSVADDLGNAVGSAAVSITLTDTDANRSWAGSGSTGTDGTVTFRLRNAANDCYLTVVTNIVAAGLDWNGSPGSDDGSYCKSSGNNNRGNNGSLQSE